MSKIKQDVRYERALNDAKVHAHVDLTNAQLAFTAERSAGHKALADQAIAYERKYTDGQFGQLNIVAQEHRIFHEREHELYEGAIERASTAIITQLRLLETDVERLRDESHRYMSVERFEREHEALEKTIEAKAATLAGKASDDHELLVKLLTQVGTVRGIAVFVGLPGIIALLWTLLAAFSNQTVTGPGGFIP
jgi:inorganic pyrophosphatase/exopolyphosphatase